MSLSPRLVIGFILFVISGAIFGQLFITLKSPPPKKLSVNPHKPISTSVSPTLLNFTHPNGSYSFDFPSNWNLLYLNPEETILMVAPQDKIALIKQKPAGFGLGSDLVVTISQSNTKPKITSDKLWDITSKEAVSIDNQTGTKTLIQVVKDNAPIIDIVIPHQNTYLNLQLLDNSYESTFNQILTSFRLLPFNEADIPASPSPEASVSASPAPDHTPPSLLP